MADQAIQLLETQLPQMQEAILGIQKVWSVFPMAIISRLNTLPPQTVLASAGKLHGALATGEGHASYATAIRRTAYPHGRLQGYLA